MAPAWWFSSRSGTVGCSGHCKQARCHGEAAVVLPQLSPFSRTERSNRRRISCRRAGSSSGPVARTCSGRYAPYIEECDQHDFDFDLDFDCLAFFGLGDGGFFHWRLWCLVSGSYSKIYLLTSFTTQKHMSVTSSHLRTLAAAFQVLPTEFSSAGPETSSWLCSVLFAWRHETEDVYSEACEKISMATESWDHSILLDISSHGAQPANPSPAHHTANSVLELFWHTSYVAHEMSLLAGIGNVYSIDQSPPSPFSLLILSQRGSGGMAPLCHPLPPLATPVGTWLCRASYGVYVAITECPWLSRGLHGSLPMSTTYTP